MADKAADKGAVVAKTSPDDSRAKPNLSVPELRRKIAESKGENHRSYLEWSMNETEIIPEEKFGQLEARTREIIALERQLEAAERWSTIDARVSEGEGRGRAPGWASTPPTMTRRTPATAGTPIR